MLVMVEHHISIHQTMLARMAIRMRSNDCFDSVRFERDVLGRSMGGNGQSVDGFSKMAFQIFNEFDHWLVIRNADSDFGLVHNRDMHCCATVLDGERWRIKSLEFSGVIRHVQNHTRSLNEWQAYNQINHNMGPRGNENASWLAGTHWVG
jgi:hypothetical protein